jgi:hypothetical protein
MLSFILFERTFLCVFNGSSIKSWPLDSKAQTTFGLSVLLSTAPARFFPQMRGKHLLNGKKNAL